MSKRRVLIVDDSSLLADGVAQLLGRQPGIELLGAVAENYDSIISSVNSFTPEVLIVNDAFAKTDAQLLWQLLKTCPYLQIVVIGLDDNRLSVLNNQEVAVNTSADLISIILEPGQGV